MLKKITTLILALILLTSGPLSFPIINYANTPPQIANASTQATNPTISQRTEYALTASTTSGESPCLVDFTASITDGNETGNILAYKWDFDGDTYADYASINETTARHVYDTNKKEVLKVSVTILFRDGSEDTASIDVTISPRQINDWLEVRNIGGCTVGVRANGSILLWNDWDILPLRISKYGVTLTRPSIQKNSDTSTRLTYTSGKTHIDATLEYGVAGRVFFNFTEYAVGVDDPQELGKELLLPVEENRGTLSYRIEEEPSKESLSLKTAVNQTPPSPGIALTLPLSRISAPKMVKAGTGAVYGSGGASYSPWRDQGLTPYGEYFSNLKESVSSATGLLTVTQTDLTIPGRGLDLSFRRVYAQPGTMEEYYPASATDYAYQSYPWIPMGNGWELGLPWIEYTGSTPTYIHFGNGQRYKYLSASDSGVVYNLDDNVGEYFTLYKYTSNSSYALYTIDGTRYDFNSLFKPVAIHDPYWNSITFTCTGNKITSITDTIGRTISLTYNAAGLLYRLSSDSKTWEYEYSNPGSGYQLTKVTDPEGRATVYRYLSTYILNGVQYPSGGYSWYTYSVYYSASDPTSSYSRYRVASQGFFNGTEASASWKQYEWTGNFWSISSVTVRDYENGVVRRASKYEYGTNVVTEYLYDGDAMLANQVYKSVQTTSASRRRITIDKYPGPQNSTYVTMVRGQDDWGNEVYQRGYEGQESYQSYANTDSEDRFTTGSAHSSVFFFSNSFYSNTVNGNIHSALVGSAKFMDGLGSLPVESYYKLDACGSVIETKSSKELEWVTEGYQLDQYGNVVKRTDGNGHNSYYVYDQAYSGAYVTSSIRTLEGSPNVNVTKTYVYTLSTGLLSSSTDEKGNSTDYTYDDVGRVTGVTWPSVDGVRDGRSAEYDDGVYSSASSTLTSVANSTSDRTVDWYHGNTFSAAGRIWVMYYDGATGYVKLKSSLDGSSWSTSIDLISNALYIWSGYSDGVYLHLTYIATSWDDLYYRRCQLNYDGTVTWSTTGWNHVIQNSYNIHSCAIAADSNHYPIISRMEDRTTDGIWVMKSSTNDGTWTTQFDVKACTVYHNYCFMKLVPLTNGKVAHFVAGKLSSSTYYLKSEVWNGSSTTGLVTVANLGSTYTNMQFDAVAFGDDLRVVYQSSGVKYAVKNIYSSTWGSATQLATSGMPQLAATSWGELWALYVSGSDIKYRRCLNNSWGTEATLVSGDSPTSGEKLSAADYFDGVRLPIVYLKGAGSPYTIRCNVLPLYSVDPGGVSVTDEEGNVVVSRYDGLGRLQVTETYNGTTLYSTEETSYNYQGLVRSRTTAVGNLYTYTYNALGQTRLTVNPDGSEAENTYDYQSNSVTVLDEEDRKKVLDYDWAGSLVSVKEYYDASNYYLTEYIYDDVGNLLKTHDSKGEDNFYVYDQGGRLRFEVYPDGSTEEYGYDPVGNLVYRVDRSGQWHGYEYDSLDRVVKEKVSSSPPMLSGWSTRKKVVINGTSVGAQYGYQIKFRVNYGSGSDSPTNIYCASGCKSDFGDIRFTLGDGQTTLNYWVEKKVDSSYADIWVKVPVIPDSPGHTRIYLYYGNSGASSDSNGYDTFDRFEDFESYYSGQYFAFGDFFAWTIDGTVRVSNTRSYDGGLSLYAMDSNNVDEKNYFWWNVNVAHPLVMGDGFRTRFVFYQENAWGDDAATIGWNTGSISLSLNDGNVISRGSTVTTYTQDAWHTLELAMPLNVANPTMDLTLDGVEYTNLTTGLSEPQSSLGWLSFYLSTNSDRVTQYMDGLFAARYADPEPAPVAVGSAESSQSTPSEATYSYDKLGNRLSSSWNGTSTSWTYDARGRVTRERFTISSTNYDVAYTYDGVGNVVQMTYPDGYRLNSTYDALNRLETLGSYATYDYKLDDQVDLIHYGNGVQTDYTYDSRSRPTQIRVYNGGTTLLNCTYTYDDSGSITQIRNATSTETYGYDQLDRLTSTSGPWGSIAYTYDSVGNMLTKGSTSYTYNNMNQLTHVGTSQYTYDPKGNLVARPTAITTGQLSSVATGLTTSSNVNYSNQRKTWYAAGRFWVMYSDGANLRYRSSLDGLTWSSATTVRSGAYGYYLSSTWDGTYVHYVIATGGNTMFYRRGVCGSDGVITWSSEQSITGGLTSVGRPTIGVDSNGRAYIGYMNSSLPYVTKNANTDGTWSTASGFPHKLSSTTGTWSVSVAPLTGGKVAVTYGRDGTVLTIVRFDGSSTWGSAVATVNTLQYGSYSSLVSVGDAVHVVYSKANKDIVYQNWTYSGNVWGSASVIQGSVTTSSNAPQLSYDSVNDRLFCVWLGFPTANRAYYSVRTGSGSWGSPVNFGQASSSFASNSGFTVSSSAVDGQVLVAWTEGSANPWTLKFTWLGSSFTYSYDAFDWLSTVSLSGGVVRRHSYDADGRRVRSFDGASGNMRYVYSGLNVVYEVPDGGGSATLRFYANGLQVAEKVGSTVSYLHQDHLGSTRLTTDSSGNRVFRSNYQPFGVDSGRSGSEEFRYTGKPSDDATGLYYFGARYYDPTIGRFITADNIFGNLNNPHSLNKYIYCLDNPHKYTDPTGHLVFAGGGDIQGGMGFAPGASIAGHEGYGMVYSYNGWWSTTPEIGYYESEGEGYCVGAGFSASAAFTVAPFTPSISDFRGDSRDISIDLGFGTNISFTLSLPIVDGKVDLNPLGYWSFTLSQGVGASAKVTVMDTHTEVTNFNDVDWSTVFPSSGYIRTYRDGSQDVW